MPKTTGTEKPLGSVPAKREPADLTPQVGLGTEFGGARKDWNRLCRKINEYLRAESLHTCAGLAVYLRCRPEHLLELESGKLDAPGSVYRVSDLLRQFRLVTEDEWCRRLPVKTEEAVERMTGRTPDAARQEADADAALRQFAG